MNNNYINKVENTLTLARVKNWQKPKLNESQKFSIIEKIKKKLKSNNAVLVCHFYVDGIIQDLALSTGGVVSDSLEMARFGRDCSQKKIIVAGVRFMGETAKILSPEKKIFMPSFEATCSLDIGCPQNEFNNFCDEHPERTVIVYANTSAAVKARSDWTVTSSCALDIVKHLKEKKIPLIFAPDKHLGSYITKKTGADILNWDGHCVVHDEFKSFELKNLKEKMPDAKVLVHPESPDVVVELADFVGSTSQLLNFSIHSSSNRFIIATDNGLIHAMRKKSPNKSFFEAPTAGNGATCKSCAHCPWMEMNDLNGILSALENSTGEIFVPEEIATKAMVAINKMLDFTK